MSSKYESRPSEDTEQSASNTSSSLATQTYKHSLFHMTIPRLYKRNQFHSWSAADTVSTRYKV